MNIAPRRLMTHRHRRHYGGYSLPEGLPEGQSLPEDQYKQHRTFKRRGIIISLGAMALFALLATAGFLAVGYAEPAKNDIVAVIGALMISFGTMGLFGALMCFFAVLES